jgi:hypothetical protein
MKPLQLLRRLWKIPAGASRSAAMPAIGENTFVVWEPCTHSHAEVVPGFVRYLLDLGYEVCVCVTPARYDEGLFSRFSDPRIHLCRMTQRALRRHFRRHGLGAAAGVLVTTARKISGADDYSAERQLFASVVPPRRVLLVEHDVRGPADHGALTGDIITLQQVHYGNAVTTVVNPHYFGRVAVKAKGTERIRFVTIGALRSRRRNAGLLVEAIARLHDDGVTGFDVVVIGRGSLRGVPARLRPHITVLGRVDFSELYRRMEEADFVLPLLDPANPRHGRYITTGTSGSFQLVFGFRKPCLIERTFASATGLDTGNALVYDGSAGLAQAMAAAIRMGPDRYARMQEELASTADRLYATSLENLRGLISGAGAPTDALAPG